MKFSNRKRLVAIWLLTMLSSAGTLLAQNRQEFSLNEAIKFAIENNLNVKNSGLDALSSEARIQELKGLALPQVSIAGSLSDNLIIQRVFLPAQFGNPNAPADAPRLRLNLA